MKLLEGNSGFLDWCCCEMFCDCGIVIVEEFCNVGIWGWLSVIFDIVGVWMVFIGFLVLGKLWWRCLKFMIVFICVM